jgi:porphobilinogen deaminase
VILAAAGLRRLGRAGEITEILDPEVMLSAPRRVRWRWSAARGITAS